jgi:hypothetical protein
LLVAKKNAQETFLRSVLKNEGKCWAEFYKYVRGVEVIEKMSWQSKTAMDGSLLIQ